MYPPEDHENQTYEEEPEVEFEYNKEGNTIFNIIKKHLVFAQK